MSSHSADTENCETAIIEAMRNDGILEMEFNAILNHLFHTHFTYIQALLYFRRNTNGLISSNINLNRITTLFIFIARCKLFCFMEIDRFGLIMKRSLKFNVNSEKEVPIIRENILDIFVKRETIYNEMLLCLQKKSLEFHRFELFEFLNGIISRDLGRYENNYKKLKKILHL
ncbi:hypothetical protein CWI39_1050p0010 [Hamiltosporidium magnivora]|uniref:Uncharacterized protein n=2 Tax=Hamiltosporidium TaxID=1176354 RepID=A0A4Q9L5W0_9MICR|nr:hypothetical protein CWI39_1050p0010 [Hamiltosporidium magnivora]